MGPVQKNQTTSEQVILKLRCAEKLVNQVQTVADVCRVLDVWASPQHRWQQFYGKKIAAETKPLREFELENIRLKRLLPDAEFDKAMLKELAKFILQVGSVGAASRWFCMIDSVSPSGVSAGRHAKIAISSIALCVWQAFKCRSSYGGPDSLFGAIGDCFFGLSTDS